MQLAILSGSLYQNEKKLDDYYHQLDANKLPVAKGLVRTVDDEIREEVIMNIMCNGRIDKNEFAERTDEIFDNYFDAEQPVIEKFSEDGLLNQDKAAIWVTVTGRYMLRNIAMIFDFYRRSTGQYQNFSRILLANIVNTMFQLPIE